MLNPQTSKAESGVMYDAIKYCVPRITPKRVEWYYFMRIALAICLFLMVTSARAESLTSVEQVRGLVSAPSAENLEKAAKAVGKLEKGDILKLILSAKNSPITEQFLLAGMLWRHREFTSVYDECMKEEGAVKAICIVALEEERNFNGAVVSRKELSVAINMLHSGPPTAARLVALTLTASGYYSPKAISRLIEVLELDLSNNSIGSEIKSLYQRALEKITVTQTSALSESERVAFFKGWANDNKYKLKSANVVYGENTTYVSILHGFSLALPAGFKEVVDPRVAAGKVCMFADIEGRSILVETYPIASGLDKGFKELEKNVKVKTKTRATIGGHPAIWYEADVQQGVQKGVFVDGDNKLILVSAYVPFNKSVITALSLLKGFSMGVENPQ